MIIDNQRLHNRLWLYWTCYSRIGVFS